MPGWIKFNEVPESDLELTDEDKELLDKMAAKIVSVGMAVPAVFFIESTKPLSYIGSQVMVFFGPFLEMFFPGRSYYQLTEILEDRKNLDYLLSLIEEKEDHRNRERAKLKKIKRSRLSRLFNRRGKV